MAKQINLPEIVNQVFTTQQPYYLYPSKTKSILFGILFILLAVLFVFLGLSTHKQVDYVVSVALLLVSCIFFYQLTGKINLAFTPKALHINTARNTKKITWQSIQSIGLMKVNHNKFVTLKVDNHKWTNRLGGMTLVQVALPPDQVIELIHLMQQRHRQLNR